MTDSRTTELLREGLAKRGIEWRSGLEGVTFVGDWCFVEYENGKLAATCEPVLTPEQAIAATLGAGECENVTRNERANQFECSECHCIVEDAEDYYVNVYERGKYFYGNTYEWNFCPNCGRAVKR